MPIDLKAMSRPTSRRTEVASRGSATSPVDGDTTTPHWLEPLRTETGYRTVTVALDLWSAAWSVGLALWWTPGPVAERDIAAYTCVFVPVVVMFLGARSMYQRRLSPRFLDEFEPVETAVALSALVTLMVLIVAVPPSAPDTFIGYYVRPSDVVVRLWLCAAVIMPAVRLVRSLAQRYLRRKFSFGSAVLVVGSGPIAYQLIARMRQMPEYGLRPVGLLDDIPPSRADALTVPYLGKLDDLESAVRATKAKKLIVAPSTARDERLALTAQRAQSLGLRVRVVPRLMDAMGSGARVEHLVGIPLIVLNPVDPKGWQFAVKHVSDRLAAGFGLLLISPLFIGLALLVKLSSPGPLMFSQERIGRDGKVFPCLKFRSMRAPDPAAAAFDPKTGVAPGGVEGIDRRTWIGKIMRKSSLDELPQLLNVLRGDMSLVGPRPERPEFVELFEIQIRRYGARHRVKAGMTGWAQVHGLRGQTSIADRAEFDNYYIENWNLLLDWKILLLTVLAVLRSAGE